MKAPNQIHMFHIKSSLHLFISWQRCLISDCPVRLKTASPKRERAPVLFNYGLENIQMLHQNGIRKLQKI